MKIAVVAPGSAQFMAELADLCALDGTGRHEVALVDTDPGRLAVVEQFGRPVAAEMNSTRHAHAARLLPSGSG